MLATEISVASCREYRESSMAIGGAGPTVVPAIPAGPRKDRAMFTNRTTTGRGRGDRGSLMRVAAAGLLALAVTRIPLSLSSSSGSPGAVRPIEPAAQTVAAGATSEATTQTLVNDIRAARERHD